MVWRRHLPVRADDSFDAKAAKRFFEAAPPHTSEQLETDTRHVLGWLIERAATVTGDASEALLDAKQVVAIALGRRGEPKGWRTLSKLAAAKSKGKNEKNEAKTAREQVVKELENLLVGATLVIDARLGGLSDGLLNEKANTTAEASDDGSTVHGAYGPRLFNWEGRSQWAIASRSLRRSLIHGRPFCSSLMGRI